MSAVKSATDLFLWDYESTLFPLSTNKFMIERYSKEIRAFIQENILGSDGSFQQQHRVFAAKRGWFLRRTVKLDPVAEFFLYDIVYRNRSCFVSSKRKDRQVFGFRLSKGEPISSLKSYAEFKAEVARKRATHSAYAYFDVASFFNHIYHHDLVRWFEDAGAGADDVLALGKFLREIVTGRSVDCLPQGLYPSKMIGSAFLNFLENSNRVTAAHSARLMDDMWLFDNDSNVLVSDFLVVQSLLGDRGLTVNDMKSAILEGKETEFPKTLDDMKIALLRRRREELETSGYEEITVDDSDDPSDLDELSEEEQDYLLTLLKSGHTEEEDAELVLTLMKNHAGDVVEYLPVLLGDFPSLAKRIYHFCRDVQDVDEVASALCHLLRSDTEVTEFQLFWFARLAEDHLMETKRAGELLRLLFEHESATAISKAKILEMPLKKHGLPDLREEQLRTGHSDWLAWASAVGSRVHPKGQRNQMLKYFRKSSPMNRLIGEFVESVFN